MIIKRLIFIVSFLMPMLLCRNYTGNNSVLSVDFRKVFPQKTSSLIKDDSLSNFFKWIKDGDTYSLYITNPTDDRKDTSQFLEDNLIWRDYQRNGIGIMGFNIPSFKSRSNFFIVNSNKKKIKKFEFEVIEDVEIYSDDFFSIYKLKERPYSNSYFSINVLFFISNKRPDKIVLIKCLDSVYVSNEKLGTFMKGASTVKIASDNNSIRARFYYKDNNTAIEDSFIINKMSFKVLYKPRKINKKINPFYDEVLVDIKETVF